MTAWQGTGAAIASNPCGRGHAADGWRKIGGAIVETICEWRARRAATRTLPVDDRILRDIGVTRRGIRESALAARNEARVPLPCA